MRFSFRVSVFVSMFPWCPCGGLFGSSVEFTSLHSLFTLSFHSSVHIPYICKLYQRGAYLQTPLTGGQVFLFSWIFLFFCFFSAFFIHPRTAGSEKGGEKAELLGWQMGRGYGWLAEEDTNRRKTERGGKKKEQRGRCRWRGDFSREELARGRRSAGMISIQLDLFASIPFCYDFWVCQFVFLSFILMNECEHCGFYHVLGCSWVF